MPSNNYGPWYTTASGGGSGAVNSLSLQTPPQSPSGSVTGESAAWNFENSETSTENYVSNMIAAAQEATAFNTTEPSPALNVSETTPAPPTNSFVQEGTPAISNIASITASFAGVAANQLAVFRWE